MLAAILFDLDGTLANTDTLHFAIWQKTLAEYGLQIDLTFYQQRVSGKVNEEILRDILPQLSVEEVLQFTETKEKRYRELAQTLSPTPGLAKLLQWIKQNGLKQAVVTNAPRNNAIHTLEVLNLTTTFPTVILAEDAPLGKPDPAPYQMALNLLGVDSQNAIAFEDSTTGIHSAVAAGIYTIGVTSTYNSETLLQAGAIMTLADFNNGQLWSLLAQNTN
ncbi:MAG: HAD-IA family hydrolase [Xenococcaceae cyanobacterium MO_188.B29]|nr:HAD-IA family hydrolase [Xenococcaceae cyanobacterium MO_188.B29]